MAHVSSTVRAYESWRRMAGDRTRRSDWGHFVKIAGCQATEFEFQLTVTGETFKVFKAVE